MGIAERLWAKVSVVGPNDCWLWTASTSTNGYGQFYVDGAPRRAHRIVYEMLVGPIPVGYEVDHLCFTILCCNPLHLEAVTKAENRRRQALRKQATGQCKRGHDRSALPLIVKKNGKTECRTCARERDRERYANRGV